MRCRILALVMVCLLTFSLAGCGSDLSTSGQADTSLDSQTDHTADLGRDMTVHLDETLDLTGKQIELSYSMSNRLAPCETLEELGAESTAVIQAKIVGVDYFRMTTMPYTKIDLQIITSLKGELKEGDKISAYKLGGYIQLKHSDPDIQQRYPEVTDEEMENKVFDRRIDGDPHPTVGQEGVFFLKPKVGDMPEGLYLITDGYDGQFMKRTDGNYARHYEGNASFEQNQGLVGYSLDDPGSAYETDRSQQTGLNGVLSYESIKAALTE